MDPLSVNTNLGQFGKIGTTPSLPGGSPANGASPANGSSFKDILMNSLNEVNNLQNEADTKLENYVTGKTSNPDEVVSASQKASMAFSMLTQIRNKLQDAYDEVKNLRI